MANNVATFSDWLQSLPKLTDEEIEKAWTIYNRVLSTMERYVPEDRVDDETIVMSLGTFRDTGGDQMIAEGSVSDTSIRERNEWNWHFQNTSQWLFAFGIVFDKQRRDFSMHT